MIMILELGLVAGLLLNLTDIVNIRAVMKEGFSSFFLIVLLPPILYESAINMERVNNIICFLVSQNNHL